VTHPARGLAAAEEPRLDLERAVFFSDAVFAIAITLLIIEVRLPTLPSSATDADVRRALAQVMPQILAFALSFVTIGVYWVAHWRRFRYIVRADVRLVSLNLVLLGLVAFIPFPTAMIGQHGDLPTVTIVYAVTLAAAGIAGPLVWLYAWQAGLVVPGVTARFAWFTALRGVAFPTVMLASIALLTIEGPYPVESWWVLILPLQFLINRALRTPEPEPHEA
jgi:uncharacterized membrane protein